MYDSATSTLEYRPPFGRPDVPLHPCRDGIPDEAPNGVDAIAAELRLRILSARSILRAPPPCRLPR